MVLAPRRFSWVGVVGRRWCLRALIVVQGVSGEHSSWFVGADVGSGVVVAVVVRGGFVLSSSGGVLCSMSSALLVLSGD